MKSKTKAAIEAFRAVSEIASYLQIVNGGTPSGINTVSDLVSSNSSSTTPNIDSSLNGTTIGKLNTVLQGNQAYKDAYNTATNISSSLTNLQNVNTNITPSTIGNDMEKIGGNIFTAAEINALSAVKTSFQPKTIQDIIDQAKAKTS